MASAGRARKRSREGRGRARSGLPAVEEVGDGLDVHVAHIFELLVLLGEEELAGGVQDGERGDA